MTTIRNSTIRKKYFPDTLSNIVTEYNEKENYTSLALFFGI